MKKMLIETSGNIENKKILLLYRNQIIQCRTNPGRQDHIYHKLEPSYDIYIYYIQYICVSWRPGVTVRGCL